MTVAVDDWAEAVRQAIEGDPDQPDRALLSRLLDDVLSSDDTAVTAARLRQRASDLRAATAELAAVTATGDQVRNVVASALPVVRSMADDIQAKATRLADLEVRHAPSDAIAAFQANFVASMADMKTTVLGAHKERWSAELLSSFVPAYLASKARTLKQSKHLSTLGPRIGLFIRTVGDKAARDYDRADFESFRDILDRTPSRWEARFKTKNLAEAVTANDAMARPLPPMEPKTVDDGYLSHVKNLFSWLEVKRKIEWNPGTGIVSNQTDPQQRVDEGRRAFKADALSTYFAYVVRTRPQTSPDYWLPLLGLYTGARLNELCQIDPTRVIQRDDVWLVDLLTVLEREELARLPEADRLKLKSPSARREIPIHDDLVRAGFLEFVERRRKRGGRLFPTLKPNEFGYYSAAISKRLNLDIGRAGAKGDRISFHSLRHTFRDALTQAEVPDRTADRVMGHVIGGAQGHYGEPTLKPAEVAAVRRISFPGVDLSPYMDPTAVRRPIRRKKARGASTATGERRRSRREPGEPTSAPRGA